MCAGLGVGKHQTPTAALQIPSDCPRHGHTTGGEFPASSPRSFGVRLCHEPHRTWGRGCQAQGSNCTGVDPFAAFSFKASASPPCPLPFLSSFILGQATQIYFGTMTKGATVATCSPLPGTIPWRRRARSDPPERRGGGESLSICLLSFKY